MKKKLGRKIEELYQSLKMLPKIFLFLAQAMIMIWIIQQLIFGSFVTAIILALANGIVWLVLRFFF